MAPSIQERFRGGSLFRRCMWRLHCVLGKGVCWAGYSLALLFCLTETAHSQLSMTCNDSSLRELERAIENHNEHAYRLNKKFKDVWYPQGPIPAEVRKLIGLEDVRRYLAALGERRTAVLFDNVESGYLHSWLITYRGKIICASPRRLTQDDWKALQPGGWNLLGVRGAKHPRTATPLDDKGAGSESQPQNWDVVLSRLSDILLPHEVKSALEAERIDTLVVVPITVREFNPSVDEEAASATHVEKGRSTLDVPSGRAALSIGVVPFAALPIGGDVLINRMSVIIAPGFFSFARSPEAVRGKYFNSIVIGNPERQGFQNLPGAEEEARYVANRLRTDRLFVAKKASKAELENHIRQTANSVDFIHLATHGIADAENPVDESFLVFSDGLWNAREISRLRRQEAGADLPLLQARPLVVMSACQTALGKDFPAGTIGLARAWQWAGASNVVMSVWSVDDEATKDLMVKFVDLVAEGNAVDKALQSAMVKLRSRYSSPSLWAGFSVYGAPERLNAVSSRGDKQFILRDRRSKEIGILLTDQSIR